MHAGACVMNMLADNDILGREFADIERPSGAGHGRGADVIRIEPIIISAPLRASTAASGCPPAASAAASRSLRCAE